MRLARPFIYSNPHLETEPGIVRDPFIVKVGEIYYLTGTLRPIWAGPNAGVPLWSSPDLLNWKNLGLLIERDQVPDDAWYKDRWWAPEIHHAGNWFYLTVGGRNEATRHKHGVAIWRAKEITGPYELLNPEAPFPPAVNSFIRRIRMSSKNTFPMTPRCSPMMMESILFFGRITSASGKRRLNCLRAG